MFWKVLSQYSATSFKRATGIHKSIFLELVQIIAYYKSHHRKSPQKGRKAVLSTEDLLLMVLTYLREYLTQYHIGLTYGLSESTVCETIRTIEDIIIKDNQYIC
jgi:Helix-turn-helix of DDE superfamily endonuclease